jgi:hypothetical protein
MLKLAGHPIVGDYGECCDREYGTGDEKSEDSARNFAAQKCPVDSQDVFPSLLS